MPTVYLLGMELTLRGFSLAHKNEWSNTAPFWVRSSLVAGGYSLPGNVKYFDHMEKACSDSCEAKDLLAKKVLAEAAAKGFAGYAVPGHPLAGDLVAQEICFRARNQGMEIKILPAPSLWEIITEMLPGEFRQGLIFFDALALNSLQGPERKDILVTGIYSLTAYNRWLDKVVSFYGKDHEVQLLYISGKKAGQVEKGSACCPPPLPPDGVACLRIVPSPKYLMEDLVHLMARLRGPHGCPWDRLQNHTSLRPYLLEEAFEVVEAINNKDMISLREELGDLLLQVIFHSCLAQEKDKFNIWQVIHDITAKITRRHPHVFGGRRLNSAAEVLTTWQAIKSSEKSHKGKGRFDFPAEFPSLLRCQKIQKKAADVGFDWPEIKGALEKLEEEIGEIKDVYNSSDQEKIEEELGDLLFAAVNVARFLKVDAETALNKAIEKFIRRFAHIEERVQERGGDFSKFCLKELDLWWDEAKNSEK